MATSNNSRIHRIVIDRRAMGGKPIVRDTGITVEQVLDALARHPEPGNVLKSFPQLTILDIQAALEFARSVVGSQRSPAVQRAIEELHWSDSEAAETRERLLAFADDWEDPSMDVYDASTPG